MPLKDLLKLPLDLDHPDAPALMDGPVAQQWRLNGNPSAKSFTMATLSLCWAANISSRRAAVPRLAVT
jgi:hypothetical protein